MTLGVLDVDSIIIIIKNIKNRCKIFTTKLYFWLLFLQSLVQRYKDAWQSRHSLEVKFIIILCVGSSET